MELSFEIFSEYDENNSSEKIICKIKNGEWNDILNGLCSIKGKSIILNYICFKHFATNETYNYILNFITNNIDKILQDNPTFDIYINMRNLTLSDVDKHKTFIQNISIFFKEKYPNKLSKCYIYNAPFVFSQIFNIINIFIDKDTQKKIELVNK